MFQTAASQSQSKSASVPRSESTTGALVIGPGIVLSGEIGACERLDVQGTLTADLKDTRDFSVAAGGQFQGSASVQTATVSGHLEGELVVEGLLKIESSGRVTGQIQFGELQIERGGTLRGQVGITGG